MHFLWLILYNSIKSVGGYVAGFGAKAIMGQLSEFFGTIRSITGAFRDIVGAKEKKPILNKTNLILTITPEERRLYDPSLRLMDQLAEAEIKDKLKALGRKSRPLILAIIYIGGFALARPGLATTAAPPPPVLVVCATVGAGLCIFVLANICNRIRRMMQVEMLLAA